MIDIFNRVGNFCFKEDDMLSSKDCPNHCINGYYFDPRSHKKVLCQYCADKRKRMVTEGGKDTGSGRGIQEILHLPSSHTGSKFDVETVFPSFVLKDLVPSSVEEVKDILNFLYNDISVGEVADCSVIFNLGKKAYENNFIYAYLTRAYVSGLTVAPYLTAFDLVRLRKAEENSITLQDFSVSFSEILKMDVCVVVIDAGATHASINAVKGLMQMRSHYDRSTIIFTNAWGSAVLDLCIEGDGVSNNLAKLFSIQYTDAYLAKERKYLDTEGGSMLQSEREVVRERGFSDSSTPVGYKSFNGDLSKSDFNNLISGKQNL